ncbi:MAG TPA: GNAT family N-acetyltransferase [Caulobacteraceae bacterium]|jgi:aminoglycoside 6'-N-acetyltransferase|nr:GNAT family N-acetyltransferase [Caulobacteraceae bacterium]
MTEAITFRPLTEADLPLMTDWLNRDHLRAFYQREAISVADVAAKYGPRIRGEAPTRSSLALLGGAPFGYLQCYRIADWADWQTTIGVEHGISIDLFIGEAELIGRGTGRQMLGGYVEQVAFPTYPSERLCWIAHELENLPARRCSAAAGFAPVREFVEDGHPSILMVRQAARP